MKWFALNPASYSIAIDLVIRLLGVIYVIAYVPFLFQIRGLLGKRGIRPVADYLPMIKARLGWKRFYYVPTIFWLHVSDFAFFTFLWVAIALGVLLAFGVFPALILLFLYFMHLSLTSVGQEFLGFGWETFLMEVTLGLFFVVATSPLNVIGWIGLNFLLFRFFIQAGASKLLSRDKSWRELTALKFHYFTQPLPNTVAWYIQKMPMWFHKVSVLFMFYVELVVPFGIFAPAFIRLLVFIQQVGLQWGIWFTGNLSFLNYLTVVACGILIENRYLEPFLELPEVKEPSSLVWMGLISLFASIYLVLQVMNFWYIFFPNRFFNRCLAFVQPIHIAYPHGIFAIMTTKRFEVIVEGSFDGVVWKEYEFFYKPGDVAYRPHRIAPYQPRLDWQAWFLPFASFQQQYWFQLFLAKLLQGEPSVTKLLKHNPFAEKAPQFVRALLYDYEFTTFDEKRKTGNWWKRRLVGEYAPSVHLTRE